MPSLGGLQKTYFVEQMRRSATASVRRRSCTRSPRATPNRRSSWSPTTSRARSRRARRNAMTRNNELSPTRSLKALFGDARVVVSSLSACATMASKKSVGKVVVVGAGYGGATAAKYLRLWSGRRNRCHLVDPNEAFISCPMSNLVLGGAKIAGGHHGRLRRARQARCKARARHGDRDRRRQETGAAGIGRHAAVRPPGRIARRRVHVRAVAGLDAGRRGDRAARVESRSTDSRAAPPARPK